MTFAGRYGMNIFTAVLIGINFGNVFGPPPEDKTVVGILGLASYLVFGWVGFWLDGKRT